LTLEGREITQYPFKKILITNLFFFKFKEKIFSIFFFHELFLRNQIVIKAFLQKIYEKTLIFQKIITLQDNVNELVHTHFQTQQFFFLQKYQSIQPIYLFLTVRNLIIIRIQF